MTAVFISLILLLLAWNLQILRKLRRSPQRASISSETQNWYRIMFDANMIGIVEVDDQANIHDANDYFLNLVGYTRDEIWERKLKWSDITAAESTQISLDSAEQCKKGRAPNPFPKEFIRKNGQRVSVLIASAPLCDGSGHFTTVVVDASEQKRSHENLAENMVGLEQLIVERTDELVHSQKFLDSILENIPNMIFVKDAKDLRFVRFNRAGEELLGYAKADLIGKNDYDFFPKEQADFFTTKDRKVLQGQVVYDIPEEPLATQNGLRILHTKKIPILDVHGKAQYLLGISEDITERKKAEEQRLRLAEERAARKIAENNAEHFAFLTDAINALAASNIYTKALAAFARTVTTRMGDWCLIDMLEENDQENTSVIYHKDREKIDAGYQIRQTFANEWNGFGAIQKVLQTGKPQVISQVTEQFLREEIANPDYRKLVEDLRLRSLMVIPLAVHDRILGVVTFAYCMTEQNYSPLDLTLAMDLAKRASFAIENVRLFEKAQEANRAKTAFLANMSHEVRTPLGAIIGFAELMKDFENLDEQQRTFVTTIIRNGKQLLNIVNEILDISKIESERVEVEFVPFHLPSVIQNAVTLLRPQAEERGNKLEVEISGSLPLGVVSDPTILNQLLMNTIGNAIKFTENGLIRVGVTAQYETAGKRNVKIVFSIRDTGIGLDRQQAKRLFQPFVQADSSTRRRFGGTGLGLYLSKKLAQNLGGDLNLEWSEPGQGSTFVFSIAAQVSELQVEAPTQEATISMTPLTDHAKVLVVDDSPDNRVLVSHFVAQMGAEVALARNGKEGIGKALHDNYDVVLMDIQMPEMDGFEAVAELRKQDYKKPIIALTARAMKGDRETCLSRGFDDYLIKPLDRSSLRDVLEKYMHR